MIHAVSSIAANSTRFNVCCSWVKLRRQMCQSMTYWLQSLPGRKQVCVTSATVANWSLCSKCLDVSQSFSKMIYAVCSTAADWLPLSLPGNSERALGKLEMVINTSWQSHRNSCVYRWNGSSTVDRYHFFHYGSLYPIASIAADSTRVHCLHQDNGKQPSQAKNSKKRRASH